MYNGHRLRLSRIIAALSVLALTSLAAAPTLASEPIKVVATIKPVHSLVAGVMSGVGKPVLLIAAGASPHSYALRPSEAKTLQNANLVFWIGKGLETFLEKPIAGLSRGATAIALADAQGLTLLPYRQGGPWAQHGDADHGHAAGHGHTHTHTGNAAAISGGKPSGAADLHVWLDPANAAAMVAAIVTAVSEADPAHKERYRENGAALLRRLGDLDADLREALEPLRGRPYIVFHDAYQYLEARYGLTPAGSITVSPEKQPGAKRIADLRKIIAERGAVCVFSEPQFKPALVSTLIDGTTARSAVLDPLGADLQPGPDAYFALMRGLAASLVDCLGRLQ